jgi:hypothetical protein
MPVLGSLPVFRSSASWRKQVSLGLCVRRFIRRSTVAFTMSALTICLLAVGAISLSADAQTATVGGNWIVQSPGTPAPDQLNNPMAYDVAAGKFVLLNYLGFTPNTVSYSGNNWTTEASAGGPSYRYNESMVYDAATDNIVLFGGCNNSGVALNETWLYNGTVWTQQFPATSPPARYSAAMAYDAALGKVVLFGGLASGTRLGDTWTYDGTTWTQQSPAVKPSARYIPTMAYDNATGLLVLFGGADASGSVADTWTYNGSTWTQQATGNSPSARQGPSMAFDNATGQTEPCSSRAVGGPPAMGFRTPSPTLAAPLSRRRRRWARLPRRPRCTSPSARREHCPRSRTRMC